MDFQSSATVSGLSENFLLKAYLKYLKAKLKLYVTQNFKLLNISKTMFQKDENKQKLQFKCKRTSAALDYYKVN